MKNLGRKEGRKEGGKEREGEREGEREEERKEEGISPSHHEGPSENEAMAFTGWRIKSELL